MGLYMYRTEVAAEKTAMEIQTLLLKHGATDILIKADAGVIMGISFRIITPHGHLPFTLPANIDKVHAVMRRDNTSRSASMQQARRTGWRIILRWIQSQLAYIETEMVTLDQIMLPFLEVDDGERTLYDKMLDEGFLLALPEGDHAD